MLITAINVAVAQTQLSFAEAVQIDTFASGLATNAIDGNTDGRYGNGGIITHTSFPGWWQGTLTERSAITSLIVFNRTDCCEERLNGIEIFVSDVSMGTPGSMIDTNTINYTWRSGVINDAGAANPLVVTLPDGIEGQYILIYNNHYLHIAEVVAEGMIVSVNSDPEITSTPITSADEGGAYSYTVVATDADAGDIVTLTAPEIPGWLSFDGAVLSGTPASIDVGTHTVEIVATDSSGATISTVFTITVNQVTVSGPQIFDRNVIIRDEDSSGNSTNLEVYGTSTLGPVTLDIAGGDLGPADSVDYGMAPFWLQHDGLNLALDGDQLSSDAVPFIIQNTNPSGGITFQTGATNIGRLIIDSDGNVKVSSPAGDIPTITYE